MRYRVEFRPDVLEDLREIPANLRERLRKAIAARLETAPDLYGERLGKDLLGLWKLRVGDCRVVFELDLSERRVTVWCIRNRKHVYPEAQRRWRRR